MSAMTLAFIMPLTAMSGRERTRMERGAAFRSATGSPATSAHVPRFTFTAAGNSNPTVGSVGYAFFDVTSTYGSTTAVTFTVTGCYGSVVPGSCVVEPASVSLDPYADYTMDVRFTASGTPGTVSVSVSASGGGTTLSRSR